MANQEQISLIRQGVEVWNRYRRDNRHVTVDLRQAYLSGADLRRFNLGNADLVGANIDGANLREANLSQTNLAEARLDGSILNRTDLSQANLSAASLIEADLDRADLRMADLTDANLRRANLKSSYLTGTNLCNVDAREANFREANIGTTIFTRIKHLHKAEGLEEIAHYQPSSVDTHTLWNSEGNLPETFLRGCGLSDWEIESAKLYNPELTNEQILNIQYRMYDLRATRALQISPLFISYSHVDMPFVDILDKTLVEKGIRFWRDIHDMTSGRMETQIDHAIRQNPTVLLVLSKNSLSSDWVQHEVRTARILEKEQGRDTLCPIAIDDSWKSAPWSARIMEQIMEYNILDFSGWEDKSTFQTKFSKLLSGLDLFYKKSEK